MDMIQKIRQNRAYQISKKEIVDAKKKVLSKKNLSYILPDPPREKLRPSILLKYFNAVVVIILIGLLIFLLL
jgi:hypothetical protein